MWYLLLWCWSIIGLICSVLFILLSGNSIAKHRCWNGAIASVIAAPPFVVFIATNLFLYNAHPTVQFNPPGSPAMAWHSWWGGWWPTLYAATRWQLYLYLLLGTTSLAFKQLRRISIVLLAATICSVFGYSMVGWCSPRA